MKTHISPELTRLLHELRITVVLSTYQGGLVVLISSPDGNRLVQYAKKFKRPMGVSVNSDGRLAIATKYEVEVFENHRELAKRNPEQRGKFDGIFFPRATYYTGQLDIHDLDWIGGRLIGVNTLFSCICEIGPSRSFKEVWRPSFIDEMMPEDRCHLNGYTTDGAKSYVTAFDLSNEKQGWRNSRLDSGVLMHMETETILVDNLAMPHSPRLQNQKIYYCVSALGEIRYFDLETGKDYHFAKINGFVRGMSLYQDYLFIGLSTIRESSNSFKNLPISEKAKHAGLEVFQLSTKLKVGELHYEDGFSEVFDIAIIPEMLRGAILNKEKDLHRRAVNISEEEYFWKKETNSK